MVAFALGALLAGAGIAKDMFSVDPEEEKRRKALELLMGQYDNFESGQTSLDIPQFNGMTPTGQTMPTRVRDQASPDARLSNFRRNAMPLVDTINPEGKAARISELISPSPKAAPKIEKRFNKETGREENVVWNGFEYVPFGGQKAVEEKDPSKPYSVWNQSTGREIVVYPGSNEEKIVLTNPGLYSLTAPKETAAQPLNIKSLNDGKQNFVFDLNNREEAEQYKQMLGQAGVFEGAIKDAPPSEAQAKYAFNAKRLKSAGNIIKDAISKDRNAISSFYDSGSLMGRMMMSDQQQRVQNAFANAIDAIITMGTGASYTPDQLVGARKSVMPMVGESDDVRADKLAMYMDYLEAAKDAAGKHGEEIEIPDLTEAWRVGAKKPRQTPPGFAPQNKSLYEKYGLEE